MLRLSNPQETDTTLVLSGKGWVETAKRGLGLIGYGEARCLFIFGVTEASAGAVAAMCRRFGGLVVGTVVGHTWQKSRFLSPYLRNTLWERGVAIDTLETALPWNRVEAAAAAIPAAIVEASQARGEQVLAFAHLSHLYRDGASIYTSYLFRRGADPDELLERWGAIKAAASRVIQAHGGTITHQHGIGTDHAPYLPGEKGPLGMDAIRAVCKSFDPEGMMNPGKLVS
jgi:alkyldihydroxyacetonephosphate synthase